MDYRLPERLHFLPSNSSQRLTTHRVCFAGSPPSLLSPLQSKVLGLFVSRRSRSKDGQLLESPIVVLHQPSVIDGRYQNLLSWWESRYKTCALEKK